MFENSTILSFVEKQKDYRYLLVECIGEPLWGLVKYTALKHNIDLIKNLLLHKNIDYLHDFKEIVITA